MASVSADKKAASELNCAALVLGPGSDYPAAITDEIRHAGSFPQLGTSGRCRFLQ